MVKKMLCFKNFDTDIRLVNRNTSKYILVNESRILIVVISILFLLLFLLLLFVIPVLLFYLYTVFIKNVDFNKKV